jgi:hypothetical protein
LVQIETAFQSVNCLIESRLAQMENGEIHLNDWVVGRQLCCSADVDTEILLVSQVEIDTG